MRMGGAYPGMKSYVFSRERTRAKKRDVIFVTEDLPEFVRKLRSEKGKDIWLVGGAELARAFFMADLVDEMILSVHPILLGKGIPLFHELDRRRDFSLLRCDGFTSGLVQLHYDRSRSSP